MQRLFCKNATGNCYIATRGISPCYRTYIGEAFKRNTGMTFVEYITQRRIDYVVSALKENPEVNVQGLFNYVGYRQRSTAWRNFQKITGLTPTEFVERLK